MGVFLYRIYSGCSGQIVNYGHRRVHGAFLVVLLEILVGGSMCDLKGKVSVTFVVVSSDKLMRSSLEWIFKFCVKKFFLFFNLEY